ncbi:hypothetical protein AB0B25_01025 [Nocardia sp. NPDC049190]|uniref:hypothetical protein n=1 Tax=Nocardia sp. NPDC049190 TaxID=3155650 RepID=UPI0033EF5A17
MLGCELALLVTDLVWLGNGLVATRLVATGLVATGLTADLVPTGLAREPAMLAALQTTGLTTLVITRVTAGLADLMTTRMAAGLTAALLAAAGLTVLGRGDRPGDRPRRNR